MTALYACVSDGATVLAEFCSPAAGGDLQSIAGRLLEAAPRHHARYSHSAGGLTHAFLFSDPFVFFAVAADEAPGRPRPLFPLLAGLRDAFAASGLAASLRPLPSLCLQDKFLPELRRLALAVSSSSSSSSQEDQPPPPPPPRQPPPSPPATDAQLSETLLGQKESGKERHKKGRKEKKRKKMTDEERALAANRFEGESRMEIVEIDHVHGIGADLRAGIGGKKIWLQHARMVLLVDVAVCSVLFGIWLTVCRGFQCLAN